MSFKSKLILFFLVIVILPMTASAFLIIKSAGEINQTKNEAILANALNVATQVYKKDQRQAYRRVKEVSRKKDFQKILKSGNTKKIKRYLKKEFKNDSFGGLTGYFKNNQVAFKAGNKEGLSLVRLEGRGKIKSIDFSLINPDLFLKKATFLTEKPFLLKANKKTVAKTLTTNESLASDYIKINVLDAAGKRRALVLFAFTEKNPTSQITSRPLLLGVFIGLLVLAVAVAILLQKSIRQQIAGITKKTKKISDGDFDLKVQTTGNDELSALAREINKMSQQIKSQIGALEDQSEKLEKTIALLNKTMSATLDSKKLLKNVTDSILEISQSKLVKTAYQNKGQLLEEQSLATTNPQLLGIINKAEEKQTKIDQFYLVKITVKNDKNEYFSASLIRKSLYSNQDIEMIQSIARSALLSLNNIDLHDQVLKEATFDKLTGLKTRRRFDEAYTREFLRSKRFKSPLSLIMIDVDRFKQLNDQQGHLVGDQLLEELGVIIKNNCREVDEAARFGGEEFVIILPETELSQALTIAERIRVAAENNLKTTLSAGVGQVKQEDQETDLLKRVDDALYLAKKSGRNRVAKI
jgi:diguanylate cyclase (GGDEF)-like protein